eukprot:ctg_3360.g498
MRVATLLGSEQRTAYVADVVFASLVHGAAVSPELRRSGEQHPAKLALERLARFLHRGVLDPNHGGFGWGAARPAHAAAEARPRPEPARLVEWATPAPPPAIGAQARTPRRNASTRERNRDGLI